jgi:hypothetical protein
VDTLSAAEMKNHLSKANKKKAKNKIEYQKYGICDSTINEIRNSIQYFNLLSEVDDIAESQIGDENKQFRSFKYSDENRISDFHSLCYDTYSKALIGLREKFIKEIEAINKDKISRFELIESDPKALTKSDIGEFIETFNVCTPDFKIPEIRCNRQNSCTFSVYFFKWTK